MSTTEPSRSGLCPNCDLEGEIGTPCPERGCTKRGYHFIPREYATWSEAKRPDPLVGRLVGRFLAVKLLGMGGFGTVHLALQHAMLSKKAALKVLHPQDDPETLALLLKKFKAEAEALAVVSHPNVVQLLDYGTADDAPFLVMEYVEGARTLHDEIQERIGHGRGFTPDEIRALLEQTANGLDAAHAKGILHRDIKPENLMLQSVAGNPLLVRIVDFGLAKFDQAGTRTSKAMGTPTYMAPEQLRQQGLGPWTDLYAVGVVAYELLSSRLPFPGRTVQEIIAKKINPTYDPLADLGDLHLPPAAEDFLRRCLARDPNNRYRNAAQFKAGLADACQALGDPGRAAPRGPSTALDAELAHLAAGEKKRADKETVRLFDDKVLNVAPPRPPTAARPATPKPPAAAAPSPVRLRLEEEKPRTSRLAIGLGALALLALGLTIGLGLTGRSSSPTPGPEAPAPAAAAPVATPLPATPATPDPAPAPKAAAACEPDCDERECGDDGCGGSCGTCPPDQPCRGGLCCTCDSGPCCDGCKKATSTPQCWEYLKSLKRPLTTY